ncbi:tetratricopeptide repeat protein [Roseibium salinum]|uniref:tetratricopeptide repeat protein n=1 Tax=Roseibium salinum TaxID=1604349 RepID=UPI0036105C72
MGTQADARMAAKLYREGAETGSPDGWVQLGLLHEYGALGTRDLSEAAALYQKAADAGSSEGIHHVGTMYYWGLGVEKDRDRAVVLSQGRAYGLCLCSCVPWRRLRAGRRGGAEF